MLNKIVALLMCSMLSGVALSQNTIRNTSWKNIATSMPKDWYSSSVAKEIAENVLIYQRKSGGWPKNIEMHHILTQEQKSKLISTDNPLESTMDNNATSLEMTFMANIYSQTGDERYRKSFERGLDYLLAAQYKNGGFPQFYPLKKGYYTHITYNDNAMINTLVLLKNITEGSFLYSFISNKQTILKAKRALKKGIDCIIKTQIFIDNKPTVWCAQHDELTLAPAKARSYELPSLSGGESVGIVQFLMSINNPSIDIIKAVDGAIEWFKNSKLSGVGYEYYTNSEGIPDKRVVYKADAPIVWARFYDLDTGKPYFCDRDGVKKSSLNDIGTERRMGYKWYLSDPQELLNDYDNWKSKIRLP